MSGFSTFSRYDSEFALSVGSYMRRSAKAVAHWIRIIQTRKRLLELDDRMLADVGLTRNDVHREMQRTPFTPPARHIR